jgi:endo-1,4-beta-xylanase
MNRRELLCGMAGVVAGKAAAPARARSLTVSAFEPDGKPCGADRLNKLLLTEPNGQPCRLLPKAQADGTAAIELPKGKFEIMMILPVRDFGQVYLYADNAGALYGPSTSGELLLNYEFARSPRGLCAALHEGGASRGRDLHRRGHRAAEPRRSGFGAGLGCPRARSPRGAIRTTRLPKRCGRERWLRSSAPGITSPAMGPSPGFSCSGANAFGYAKSEEYARLYRELLNFGTVPFYRASTEKVEGSPDYSAVDAILEKMAGAGILTKGHPLVWFHYAGIPEFLKKKSWAEIKTELAGLHPSQRRPLSLAHPCLGCHQRSP